ncbi:hypothetical protein GCM10023205_23240 [Yinghuangia aomiensis]|uniref:Protein kinase domain-containing protein n=1 Tax=Yinghuangia aomiensis TaxID=676205 RepID=A0ABP9H1H1_9ACTN
MAGQGEARAFPTGADYSEALRDTTLCFAHPAIAQGTVEMGPLRMPRAVSGNFGSVFRVTSARGTGTYAVKCFTRAVPDRLRRYRAIGDTVASLPGDWRVDVEYVPNGVLVRGDWYPVVLMRWIEGTALITWLENHLGDAASIDALADRFAAVVGELEAAGIAHGDLQHGNVVVEPNGALKLIDYDGMYVPSLAGLPAAEQGHRNYQHPKRGSGDFGPGLDRFSAHVIHLGLRTLARKPQLWKQFHEEGGEHLLLKAEDYASPAASDRWAAIACAVPELADAYARLAFWAARPVGEVGALGGGGAPDLRSGRVGRGGGPGVPPARAATPEAPGLPGWLAQATGLGERGGSQPARATGLGTARGRRTPGDGSGGGSPASPGGGPGPGPRGGSPAQAGGVGGSSGRTGSRVGPGAGPTPVGGAAPRPGPPSSSAGWAVPPIAPRLRASGGSSAGLSPAGSSGASSAGASASPPSVGRSAVPSPPASFSHTPASPPSVGRSAVPSPPASFSHTPASVRWTARLAAVGLPVLVLAAVFAMAGAYPSLVLDIVVILAASAAVPVVHHRLRAAYLASAEMQTRDAMAAEQAAAETDHTVCLSVARRHRRLLDEAREQFDKTVARFDAEAAGLAARSRTARDAARARLDGQLRDLRRRRDALDASAAREELQALRDLQERLLRDALAAEPLPADLLGERCAARLADEGIATAADFTRVTSVVPTQAKERLQVVVTGPRGSVRVAGMVPALARALQEWRDNLADDIRTRLPGALPYADAQTLHRRRADHRLDLARQSHDARTAALREFADLDADADDRQRHLERLQVAETIAAASAVRTAEDRLAEARAAVDQAHARLGFASVAVAACGRLTFRRYLADAFVGR